MLFLCIAVLFLQRAINAAASEHYLRLTAVVSDEKDDHAKFECWEMATPFASYPTVGSSIMGLAEVTNVSYVVLPPRSGEGIHKPPHPMSVTKAMVQLYRTNANLHRLFVLLLGLAHVTLPYGDDELYIVEGVNGLIVANDVRGEGHFTDYPSGKASVALQIPFKDGRLPQHRVVNEGGCVPKSDMTERELAKENLYDQRHPD